MAKKMQKNITTRISIELDERFKKALEFNDDVQSEMMRNFIKEYVRNTEDKYLNK